MEMTEDRIEFTRQDLINMLQEMDYNHTERYSVPIHLGIAIETDEEADGISFGTSESSRFNLSGLYTVGNPSITLDDDLEIIEPFKIEDWRNELE